MLWIDVSLVQINNNSQDILQCIALNRKRVYNSKEFLLFFIKQYCKLYVPKNESANTNKLSVDVCWDVETDITHFASFFLHGYHD